MLAGACRQALHGFLQHLQQQPRILGIGELLQVACAARYCIVKNQIFSLEGGIGEWLFVDSGLQMINVQLTLGVCLLSVANTGNIWQIG